MIPQTRKEFSEWCLRQLGQPAVKVDVSIEQVEDNVDKALQFIHRTGLYGSQHDYYAHKLTREDITNGYFFVPNDVTHVIQAFSMSGGLLGSPTYGGGLVIPGFGAVANTGSVWNFSTSGATSLGSGYLSYSIQLQQYFSEMQASSNSRSRPVRFNRYEGKVWIDASKDQFIEGLYCMVEVYRMVPEDAPKNGSIWSDDFLGRYAVALLKRQWGTNLSKFDGIKMAGDITFNGQKIKEEGVQEIKDIEDNFTRWGGIPNMRTG